MEHTNTANDQQIKWLLEKARHFCAFQERCTSEVRRKLKNIGADNLQAEQVIQQLQQEGYLNEVRFAKIFASGKLSNNQWGREKIRHELLNRSIDAHLVNEALQEIDEPSYKNILSRLISRKASELQGTDPAVSKDKIASYCIRKGFEHDLVWQMMREI